MRIPKQKLTVWFAGLFFLLELEHLLNFPFLQPWQFWIQMAEVLCAGAVLAAGEWRKRGWCTLLILGTVWLFLTSVFRGAAVMEKSQYFMQRALLCLILLPFAGLGLKENEIRSWLRILLTVWVLFHAVLSVVGLVAAFQGRQILDGSRTLEIFLREDDHRLKLMAYSTVTASNLTTAMGFCLILTAMTGKKGLRVLYLLIMIPMLICLALTVGRTGYVCAGLTLGAYLALMLEDPLRTRLKKSLRWAQAGIAVAAVVLVILAMNGAVAGFNAIQREKPLLVSQAQAEAAEEAETVLVGQRSMTDMESMQGRSFVWRASLDVLRNKPYLLLVGTSVPQVMEHVQPYADAYSVETYDHVHCMYLQILMETGIPGLLLCLCFVYLFARACLILWRKSGFSWQKAVPLPALAIFLGECLDSMTRLDKGLQTMPVLMLTAGLTLILAENETGGALWRGFSFRRFCTKISRKT